MDLFKASPDFNVKLPVFICFSDPMRLVISDWISYRHGSIGKLNVMIILSQIIAGVGIVVIIIKMFLKR